MRFQDLRVTVRSLAKTPAFTLAVIGTLVLGLGASSAVFSVVDTVLLKPLPYPHPERLVSFTSESPGGPPMVGRGGPPASETFFNLLRQQNLGIEHLAAHRFGGATLTDGDIPERLGLALVSGDFFRLFGGAARLGRTFLVEDSLPGGPSVAVLGYEFWQVRFGGDSQVVGRRISLDGAPHLVVGVLAPELDVSLFGLVPDVWLPLRPAADSRSHATILAVTGRLSPRSTLGGVNAALEGVTADFRSRFPDVLGPNVRFTAVPLRDVMVRDYRRTLLALVAAVGTLLLIACANVANLFVVRGTQRRREIAIRAALGARRGQLVRQLLGECLLVSLVGGVGGLGLGLVAARSLLVLSPVYLPRLGDDLAGLALDWRAVGVALVVSIGTGLLFGVYPALRASRARVVDALTSAGDRAGTARHTLTSATLVVGQVALSLLLLVGAGLLTRTFVALNAVHPGFDTNRLLTMQTSLREPRFAETANVTTVVERGVRSVGALPGVAGVGAATELPLSGSDFRIPVAVVGRPPDARSRETPSWRVVSPTYFDALDLPVTRGRVFTDRDTGQRSGVVVINESLARRFWPTGDPVGEHLVVGQGLGPDFDEPPRRIIGIVGDVRDGIGLRQSSRPTVYVPLAQLPDRVNQLTFTIAQLTWIVRTTAQPDPLAVPVQRRLQQAIGGLSVTGVRTMDDVIARSLSSATLGMVVSLAFACLALLLAISGVYGLMAYGVQQRLRELSVRLALGAEPHVVRNMVVRDGMRLALVGVVVGLGASFGLTRVLGSALYGVTPLDPVVLGGVPVLVTIVALAAAWFPARRASRVDPARSLRAE